MELQQLDHKQFFKIKKFTKEEQAQYLSNYGNVRQPNGVSSFIEHIATTLDDGKGDFLGIPLHCKILAEWVESKTDLESQLPTITSKFDIISFYKHFVEEKAPNDKSLNQQSLSSSKSDAYKHYYNLSNDIVFGEKENLKKLLRISYCDEKSTPEDKDSLEKRAIECGIEFGLTYVTRTKTVKFLHKTLPEFILAQYLHKGFHFEYSKQMNLLGEKSICDLIVKEILHEKDKYKTVRMFLNLMLEDVVWKREWRNVIIQNGSNASGAETDQSNPNSIAIERLHQFVKAFRRTRENNVLISDAPEYEALDVAADEKNATIFVLLLDCIEAMHRRTAEKVKDDGGFPATFEYYPYNQNDGDQISFACENSEMDDEGYPLKAAVERFISRFSEEDRIQQPLNGETEQITQCFLHFIYEKFDEDEYEAYVAEKKINNQNNQGLKIILHAKESDAANTPDK